jgi:hypothetical protein
MRPLDTRNPARRSSSRRREVAWHVLALNTEKGAQTLEVIRISRGRIEEDARRPESEFTFYLDKAALVTLGV